MSRRLPPLNALKAFEAAGRSLSFTKAASELGVTPAAVSHQIKGLEERLGARLFRRRARALLLTDAGQAALPIISEGFDTLARGVDRLRQEADRDALTVSVGPSFAAMWLVPRLERFRRRRPDVEIRIDGTDQLVDVAGGEADVALRYGPGGYAGVREDMLFRPVNTPVCSPSLLEGPRPLRTPSDLRHHALLHIEWRDAEPTWRMWLQAAGLTDVDAARGPRFSLESLAVAAALDGQGVALVADLLAADHLRSGRLVRPFSEALATPLSFAYFILSAPARAEAPPVAAFRAWLLEEAAAGLAD